MRILLTGASGQVGKAFLDQAARRHEVVAVHHTATPGARHVDIADAAAVQTLVADVAPDWVIHAAAMTNVDACERDPEAAQAANAQGAQNVARASRAADARLVAISTDYVFDGERGGYREDDPTHPMNVYARTKEEGERRVLAAMPDAIIARTCVVFGPHKTNFVTWLAAELAAKRRVRIVEDQRVSPTYSYDLADQLLALIEHDARGIFHTAGATGLSRLEMAREVARAFELDADLIDPVASDAFTWLAKRPRDTTLNVSKVAKYKTPLAFDAALTALRARWSP